MKVVVPDMSCGHCEMRIRKALETKGVSNVVVDLSTKEVTVDLGSVSETEAIKAIEDAGYPVK